LESVADYIDHAIYQPGSYILFAGDGVFREHVYTADWEILWRPSAEGVLYTTPGEKVAVKRRREVTVPFVANPSVIDVKGEFVGKNNSSGITFPVNQKWVMDKYGVYVHKVVISFAKKGLFYRTFVPESVKENSNYVRSGLTKFKYETRSFDEYLKLVK